jgi:2-polyprenyl-3-methyl-5-hydroxy-6-metoxy-1,4-benzoquinol methylase
MNTPEGFRRVVKEMKDSAIALGALAAALENQLDGGRISKAVKAEIDGIVAVLGVREGLSSLTPSELKPTLGEMRAALLQASKLASSSPLNSGWTHVETEILQSQGDASVAFPALLKLRVAAELEGLEHRLESGSAAFLDVGVGVASLSIAMAKLWPSLRVVGIDVWRPALELARANVERARLVSRIELREQAVQDLVDVDQFDLAWLPGIFIDDATIGAAAARVSHALRPGGWLLFGTLNPSPDGLSQRVARLRTVLYGGAPRTADHVALLLRSAGYAHVRAIPAAPWAPGGMVVGRKPPL